MNEREKIIKNYIDGYNQFDCDKMLFDFDENVVFENIQKGEINMSLIGLKALRQQTEQAKSYFNTRTQTIMSFKHLSDETEIEIDYYAVLGMDFPNGLKRGDELKLKGKSIFKFLNDKIIKLTDIS
ncbi:MAG TPA: nuclear transport factor 2 family protein [Chryseolinea sp.]|nr:nuclear transport factor 2 family protein [Chryseolinea sp.]